MTQVFTLAELGADLPGAIAEIRDSGQAALVTGDGKFLAAVIPFQDTDAASKLLAVTTLDELRRVIAEAARPAGEAEARLREAIAEGEQAMAGGEPMVTLDAVMEGGQSPPAAPADEAYFSGLRDHAEARARVQAVIDRYRVRLLPEMFRAWLNGLDDRRVALLAENWDEVMTRASEELDR